MPCYQPSSLPAGVTTTGRTSYATEAECNQACKEGACCEGTTCTVKPQCQCQGAGQVFKGVGTVCTPNPCGYCGCNVQIPNNIGLAFTGASITLTSGSGTVSQKASEIEDFIEQISPTLALQGSPSQGAASFTYSALGCSDANASGCVSCPPDFRSVEGGGGGASATLGLVIPCNGPITASFWPFSTGLWRIEKPGSIFANYPCGQVRHLISMSFSTSPGSADMCLSPPSLLSWLVGIQVRSADFGANGVPEASYTGTANVTATFNYPNPLP
jgi:hypothetical protein